MQNPNAMGLSIKSKWVIVPAELMVNGKPVTQGTGHGRMQSPNAMGLAIKPKRKG